MSIQKVFTAASLVALIVLFLFVYPSMDSRINAGPSNSNPNITALKTMYPVSVSSDAVIAHYFGKDVVEKIMKQTGCVGVRMYYSKKTNGKSGFKFVGVDKNGKDLAPIVIAGPQNMCPPLCND